MEHTVIVCVSLRLPCEIAWLDMYYTYVLQSMKDNRLYTGFTKDLKQRFDQHQNGHVESTKDRRPLKLIYYEACLYRNDAINREKYLKSHYGKMFIKI